MKYRKMYILIIAILMLTRIGYLIAQPDIYSDNIAQIAMAQNFMEGHGFSSKYLDSQKEIYYSTNIQSPPLYPFLLALISFMTANPLLSSFIIQIAVLLFLVIIWQKIFALFKNLVSEEAYFYFISLIIISTSIFNIINTILIVALLILSFSIYFTFAYLIIDESKKSNLFLSSLFASLLFWTHYSYFFVAFYPAVVLFIIFYLGKNKIYLYGAVSSFVISFTVTSGVLIYNYLSTGFINYMDNPGIWEVGFFPEHLLLTNPFFLNAFFKSSYIYYYFFQTDQNILLALLFQIMSFLIFIIIAVLFLKLRKNKNISFGKISLLFIPFFVIIVFTISFLLYFTLHYKEIPSPGWTHIGDSRYLSAVFLSIIAIVVILIFVKANYLNKKLVKIFKILLICLIFISLSINIYSLVSSWDQYNYKTNDYNHKNDLQDLFNNVKLELSKGNQPIFIDNNLIVDAFRMSQLAKAAVINSSELKKIEQFPPNMVFFFILPGDEKYYRDEDYKLLDWGEKFNLKKIGRVRTNIDLYKVKN